MSGVAFTTGTFDPEHPDINTAYNYGYDALGNLVRDTREGITGIDWTLAGKVRSVAKATCKLPQDQVCGIVEPQNQPELWDNEKEQMDGSADRGDAARA